MQLFEPPVQKVDNELVFNLSEWEAGIYLPTAYIIKREKGKLTYLIAKAVEKNLPSFGISITETNRQLLAIIRKIQVTELEKKFSPPRRKIQSLVKILEDKLLKKKVISYIHKHLNEWLILCAAEKLPLCWGLERKVQASDILMEYPEDVLTPQLYFDKTSAGIDYQLTMKTGRKVWRIQEKEVIPICNYPAWLFVDYKLYQPEGINGNMVKPFLKKDTSFIKRSAERVFFETFILKHAAKIDIETKGFAVQKYRELLSAELSLTKDIFTGNLGLQLSFNYIHTNFQWNDPKLKRTKLHFASDGDDIQIQQVIRDKTKEQQFLQQLIAWGFEISKNNLFLLKKEEYPYQLIEWLQKNMGAIEMHGFLLKDVLVDGRKIQLIPPYFQQSVKKGNDWFDIFIEVTAGDFRIPFPKLVPYIREKNAFYPLPDGTYFLIPEEWLSKFESIAGFGKKMGEGLRISKSQYGLLKNINEDLTEDGSYVNWELIDFKPSKYLNAKLRPYQLAGVKWLIAHYQNNLGACLADDMGLGKTLQTITVLLHAKEEKAQRMTSIEKTAPNIQGSLFGQASDLSFLKPLNSLVILPASLVFNWENEIKKFAPSLSVYRHIGTKRHKDVRLLQRHDVLLTTYQTALKDIDLLANVEFEYIVLDESQYIKNKNAKIFKAINQLKSNHRISLSGTPIENSLSDLWSQMQFINPGHLGSATFFQREFIRPIEKLGDDDKKESLRNLVAPFLMRRTKEEVAKDLPELEVQVFYSEMSAAQKKLYETEKSKARNALLGNFAASSFEFQSLVLQTLLRLRQIVNHPKLVFPEYEQESGKFQDVLEKWGVIKKSNHKALMFSSFTKYLALFETTFKEQQDTFAKLTGATNSQKRAAEVAKFQTDPATKAFLISTKAGGTGLNLTAADYVFLLDPWWNPAAEKQAIARAHRIGQTKKVMAIKFITKDSIEEKILALQARKSALAADILSAESNYKLTKNELQFLLT